MKKLGDLQAFPTHGYSGGLTIREHFASLAMAALITQSQASEQARDKFTVNNGWPHSDTIAKCAVEMADALIKQLTA
jgi:hypothetical protein